MAPERVCGAARETERRVVVELQMSQGEVVTAVVSATIGAALPVEAKSSVAEEFFVTPAEDADGFFLARVRHEAVQVQSIAVDVAAVCPGQAPAHLAAWPTLSRAGLTAAAQELFPSARGEPGARRARVVEERAIRGSCTPHSVGM